MEREIDVYLNTLTEIRDLAYHFFTEERVEMNIPSSEALEGVDLSNSIIELIIHYPEVTITNELGMSITVKDLWAKTRIINQGKIFNYFELTRSTFTRNEAIDGYVHSHVRTRDASDLGQFSASCLGSGPIKETIHNLHTATYNEENWMLYFVELDKYIKTESLAGGPHRRMANIYGQKTQKLFFNSRHNTDAVTYTQSFIRLNESRDAYNLITKEHFYDFFKYFLRNSYLPVCFTNNKYKLALSMDEFAIIVTDLFIKWAKEVIEKTGLNPVTNPQCFILKVHYKNNILYRETNEAGRNRETSLEEVNGRLLFHFKNNPIYLNILEEDETNSNNIELKIVNPSIVKHLWANITNIINYGKAKSNSLDSCSQGFRLI